MALDMRVPGMQLRLDGDAADIDLSPLQGLWRVA